jgi:transcriptional regulator with XRE-family HTH domain
MAPDRLAQLVLREANAQGLSLTRLARKAGLHTSTLSRWVNGQRSIRVDRALKVIDVLGLELAAHSTNAKSQRTSQSRRTRHPFA